MQDKEEVRRSDLIAVLTQDHRDVDALFVAIENTGSSEAVHRKELTENAVVLLAGHAAAESQYFYPTLRMHVPEGDRLADREIRGHAALERLMKSLDGLGAQDEDFGPTLAQLMATSRAHFAEEEALLFPELVANCTREQLSVLGAMVSAARSD